MIDRSTLLCTANEVASSVASRGHEIERARAVPDEVMAQMKSGGLLQALMPSELGGPSSDWHTALDVVRTIANANTSTAWALMIGMTSNMVLSYTDRETGSKIAASGPVFISAVHEPRGSARPTDTPGMLSLRGRWHFATGARWSDLCCLGAISNSGGKREIRQFILPREQIEIVPNWDVMGLCGTGSDDVETDVVVADHSSFTFDDEPWPDEILWRIPYFTIIQSTMAAVVIGTAEGAILGGVFENELSAKGRKLAQDPTREANYSSALGLISAARASLDNEVNKVWTRAVAGDAPSLIERSQLWLACITAVEICDQALSLLFSSSGGGVIRNNHPLQRALRDVKAAGNHVLMSRRQLTPIGRALTGRDPECAPFL